MYSRDKIQLSKKDIHDIVSRRTARTLSASEERLVEEAILKARGNSESISLYKIDLVLKELEDNRYIDKFDRRDVMKAFEANV